MKKKTLSLTILALLLLLAACAAPAPGDESEEPEGEAVAAASDRSSAGTTVPPEPAAPPAAPEPTYVTISVPAGTLMDVEMLDPLGSDTSVAGDAFRASVLADVVQDGRVVIPAGSLVSGTVTEAVSLKKIGGKAKLALQFEAVDLAGGAAPIEAVFAAEGNSETKKDAGTIAGAAAAGALIGRELKDDKRKKGALIGAIVGAAAGTAIAANTEGKEVVIEAGTVLGIELTAPLSVQIEE